MDYNDSRRSRRRFDEDLEQEARAEKRIMNAKKVFFHSCLGRISCSLLLIMFLFIYFSVYQSQGYRDTPRKSSLSDAKSARRPIAFSESDREESEYETDGAEDERSPHNRIEDEEPEYEESEEEEHYEELDANTNRDSEEEEEAEVLIYYFLYSSASFPCFISCAISESHF